MKAGLDTIESQATPVLTTLEPWHGAASNDRNGHLSLQLQHPEKGSLSFDLGSPLASLLQQANAALEHVPYIALAINEESAPLLAGAAVAVAQRLHEVHAAAISAGHELSKGKATIEELGSLAASGGQVVQKLQDLLAATTVQKATVDSHAAEVEQKLARVREISKDADALHQRVTAFTAQFEAFDSQMKARLEQFTTFEAATKEAERQNLDREERIDVLTGKADTMLRGATTAGLSFSLDMAREAYEARLTRTGRWFLGSVVALLVCLLPIAAQLVPGPWQQWFQPHTGTGADPWLATLGKVILLLPATWATAFFAGNYAELFHLSREYAHKAALAKAIDGFKREAPQYEQEIVAGVFMEIQENPGSRKSPAPASPQNPLTQRILEKLIQAISGKQSSRDKS